MFINGQSIRITNITYGAPGSVNSFFSIIFLSLSSNPQIPAGHILIVSQLINRIIRIKRVDNAYSTTARYTGQ